MGGILFLAFFFIILIAGAELLVNIFRKGTAEAVEEAESGNVFGSLGVFILCLIFFSFAFKFFNANVYAPQTKYGTAFQGAIVLGALIYVGKRVRLF